VHLVLRLPVFVTDHAIETACLRSRELASVDRRAVLEGIRAEVDGALAAGRVSRRKPLPFCSSRGERKSAEGEVRFVTSADERRAYVLKLVVDNHVGVSWLVLTTLRRLAAEAAA
jgi:hypothetical protein